MKFVLLFGPQAVGKMTVGQELARKTGLKLFHNHMTIDLLEPLYGFTPEMWRLANHFREEIFTSFAKSDEDGMIFTWVWAFNEQADWETAAHYIRIFEEQGAEIYLVELEAAMDTRLLRNRTPNRLEHKPTKRNVEQSEYDLVETMKTMRLNSHEGEIDRENYLRIDNTYLSAEEVAERILERFHL